MKYKVGDKVKVRSDLEEGQQYEGRNITSSMARLSGKTVTVTRCSGDCYHIDPLWEHWTDEMFEGLVKEEGTLKFSDYMVIKGTSGEWGIVYKKENGWWHIVYQCGGQVFEANDFTRYITEVYECKEDGKYYSLQFLANPEIYIRNYTKIYPIIPQPVSFMEAVEAYSEGKTVECKHDGQMHNYKISRGFGMTDENADAINHDEILRGEWYIRA